MDFRVADQCFVAFRGNPYQPFGLLFGSRPKKEEKRFVPPMHLYMPPTIRGGTASPDFFDDLRVK